MPFPIPRPISGSRFAPKITMIMRRMTTSSGMPRRLNIRTPYAWNCSTFAGLACALLAAGPPASAQFVSGVNVVEVYASVTDSRGEPVTGLARGDFELLENGVPQTISTFTEGDFPLSTAIGVDRSFSMAGARLDRAKAGGRGFLEAPRPAGEAMIVALGSEGEITAPPSPDPRAQIPAPARPGGLGPTGLP